MSKNVRRVTYTAIAAAIIFTVTRLLVITLPFMSSGYVNIGDVSIYIISYLLGGPLAALAAGIGSALSDLTAYPLYAPATLIIKGLMGLTAGYLMTRRKFGFYALGCILGGAIMVVGYGLYDFCIGGFNLSLVLGNGLANLIQWGGGTVIALILYPVAVRIQRITHFDELK